MAGPEVCRTEYISECWTRNDPHTVVDDAPKCRTEYEEKCELTQSGYVTGERCSKWPREVCTISKELKSRGFKFCGPTIVYAFMQATGLVNDHLTTCHRHAACTAPGRRQPRLPRGSMLRG